MATIGDKRCIHCGAVGPPESFYEGNTECKDCTRARARHNYHANHERRIAQKAEYREARRERLAATQRDYRAANTEARRAYDREYAQRNAQVAAERARRWRADNPGYKHRPYLPREGEDFSAWSRILALDPCAYCGRPAETLDHITAIAEGGVNAWDNLTAACRPCNSKKRTAPLLMALLRFTST